MTNLQAPNLFGEKFTPSEDGAQRSRQQLWAEAHSMVAEKCLFAHAIGFSQWSLTKQNERRIYSARIF
ncbi:MAG: hypothetical protein NZ805_07230 [Armatimonadetes bacterium]|nr:hypothetical protein [Armatimonadota bacterium]MDW8028315.1 hypothetical protein [Armatimonadota bacterium]